MDFLIYIVVAVVASWIGWHLRGIVILANLAEDPDRVIRMLEKIKKINEEELEHTGKLPGVEIKSELVDNVWYAYAAEDNQFLGQGDTLEDALKMVADRFPNKQFWCKQSDKFSQTT